MVDICLLVIPAGLLLGFVAPEFAAKTWSSVLISWMSIAVWIGFETTLLTKLGTTPGKWLFRIRIRLRDGEQISFRMALARSYKVWWRGLGMGIPGISLIAVAIGRANLIRNGITSWDRDEGFVIEHRPLGIVRTLLLAMVIFASIAGRIVLLSAGNR